MTPALTPRQLEILQHAVGADKYGQHQDPPLRNHFCAGGDDEATCRELVAMGLMRVFYPSMSPLPYYNCVVTSAGLQAIKDQSPAPPKLTRSQKRYYRAFLAADGGMTFDEWLRGHKEAR